VQLHVRAEKQVVAIEKGVLEVCASREAYFRGDRQMDQVDYSWQVRHPKGLPIKPHLSIMWLNNQHNTYNRYKCHNLPTKNN
jgi:hypothetical protein